MVIAWSGRGRMPLRTVRGEKCVTLWTGDVRVPSSLKTIPGPESEYSSFIRSAKLTDVVQFIN